MARGNPHTIERATQRREQIERLQIIADERQARIDMLERRMAYLQVAGTTQRRYQSMNSPQSRGFGRNAYHHPRARNAERPYPNTSYSERQYRRSRGVRYVVAEDAEEPLIDRLNRPLPGGRSDTRPLQLQDSPTMQPTTNNEMVPPMQEAVATESLDILPSRTATKIEADHIYQKQESAETTSTIGSSTDRWYNQTAATSSNETTMRKDMVDIADDESVNTTETVNESRIARWLGAALERKRPRRSHIQQHEDVIMFENDPTSDCDPSKCDGQRIQRSVDRSVTRKRREKALQANVKEEDPTVQ